MYNKGVLSPLKSFIPKVSNDPRYNAELGCEAGLFYIESQLSTEQLTRACFNIFKSSLFYFEHLLIHRQISSALHELITSPKSAPENAADLVYGLAENAITLLWCLS